MKVDPYANEPVAPVDPALFAQYLEAKDASSRWKLEAERLAGIIEAMIGDAHAGTVDGRKVILHRYANTYRAAALRKDYPELTEQYVVEVTEFSFDIDRFAKNHPEVAKQYQSRPLKTIGDAL